MDWIYHVKEPQHWVSSSPLGYFIVQEKGEDGSKYVVYKGHFEDWRVVVGGDPQLEKIGEFSTLKDAKKNAPYQTSN